MKYQGPTAATSYREEQYRPTPDELRAILNDKLKGRSNEQSNPAGDKDGNKAGNKSTKANKLLGTLLGIIVAGLIVAGIAFAFVGNIPWFLYAFLAAFTAVALLVVVVYDDADKVKTTYFRIGAGVFALAMIAVDVIAVGYISGKRAFDFTAAFKIGAVLMAVMGVTIVILALLYRNTISRRCTGEGTARCIGYDDTIVRTNKKHSYTYVGSAPVYTLVAQGREYTVYDGIYHRNEDKLPRLGETVDALYDPKDPEVCIVKDKPSVVAAIFVAVVLMVFAGGLFFASRNPVVTDKQNVITDEKITSNLGTDDYKVAIRTITYVDGYNYFFAEFGGLQNRVVYSGDEYQSGDQVIYVQGPSSVMFFDPNTQEYQGDHLVPNSSEYTEDGRFILSDEYIKYYFGTDSYDLYEVEVVEVTDDNMTVAFDSGSTFVINDGMYVELYHGGVMAGDQFYLVSTEYGFFLFGKANYVLK